MIKQDLFNIFCGLLEAGQILHLEIKVRMKSSGEVVSWVMGVGGLL